MAKILITLWQYDIFNNSPSNLFCYYEGLIKELQKFDNQVFVVNRRFIAKNYFLPEIINKNELVEQVKQFNPDLIIAFNNQIFDGLLENTTCPIALFDADGIDFFSCKNEIKKFQHRYYMICNYKNWEDSYEEIDILKNRIFNIHTATAISSSTKEKTANISFIGTKFHGECSHLIKKYFKNNSLNLYNLKQEYWKCKNYNYEALLQKYFPNLDCNKFDLYNIFDNRNYILTSILDLGLKLYGSGWANGEDSNLDLMAAYDSTPIYSLKHNQDVYNSSKINLSISHPQCKGFAYPWRCYDIMASSGLLICSYSKLLEDLTAKHVKIPMYHSPYEARDLCKYALSNPTWCEDIVSASNEFINKFGRWEDNFKILENIFNINLTNTFNKKEQEVIYYNPLKNILHKNENLLKIKYKNIANGFFLILMHLPIIELLFSEKNKIKVYKSIKKYKRGNQHD